jgi:hypothetical protein
LKRLSYIGNGLHGLPSRRAPRKKLEQLQGKKRRRKRKWDELADCRHDKRRKKLTECEGKLRESSGGGKGKKKNGSKLRRRNRKKGMWYLHPMTTNFL